MSLNAEAPFVSVLISPVDPEASNRAQWTLSDNYAAFLQAGSDGGQGDGAATPGFNSVQFQNQPAFINLKGPLEFVRFTSAGRVERGVAGALQSSPDSELCGLTIQLRRESLQCTMDKEPQNVQPPSASATKTTGLSWSQEQGEWETVLPASTPFISRVRPHNFAPNTAYKIKTTQRWTANMGFTAVLDLGGVVYDHGGEPALRLTWGDKWSLVFRGQSPQARPTIEGREKNKWVCISVLRDCAPLDEKFWTTSHTVAVQIVGDRLCVQVDGTEFGIIETQKSGGKTFPTAASWPSTPLRLSLWGVDCLLQVDRLAGYAADANGVASPLSVSFGRNVPAPDNPPFNQYYLPFDASGSTVTIANDYRHPGDEDSVRGTIRIKTLLCGTGLDNVSVKGSWIGLTAHYSLSFESNITTAPLVCALAVEFAPLPTLAVPPAVEVRAALTSLSVDSGDPEELPDAEASFTLSYPLLEKLVPDWKSAILPYRPVLIRAKYPDNYNGVIVAGAPHNPEDDPIWTTLFRGFLTPDSTARGGWNDRQLPLVARGPLVRLSQPAALIDERFGPLDLQLGEGSGQLWGAQAAKNLLRVELGENWTNNFNGDGDALRFLPDGHYPLLDTLGTGFFDATQAPKSGNWRLPPPFGSDMKTWLNTLATYDHAVWFFDPMSDAFFYGRIIEFFVERGHTTWTVPETAPPPSIKTTTNWPLLSSLSKSGLLDKAYNDIRVWGQAAKGAEGLSPSFLMGRAGDSDPDSLDPLSIAQSWRRTLLIKPDFIKVGVVNDNYVNDLAFHIWLDFQNRPPVRMDAEFDTGFLGPRWGEILHLPTGFAGPQNGGQPEDWRILRIKHSFNFAGEQNRFSTTITSRTLSNTGQ